jgi:predicted MFS family arabinose efflux permease
MLSVLLGVHLARLGLSPTAIGITVGAGLTGAALAALLVTLLADHRGRRQMLLELSLLGAAGALVVAFATSLWVIVAAAFVGMLNGMGRDRGAALILDHAILPGLVQDAQRTRSFAVYNVSQDSGHALGSLLAGLPTVLAASTGLTPNFAGRSGLAICAGLMLATTLAYRALSPATEPTTCAPRRQVSRRTRGVLVRISALFLVDALGGGFLTGTLLSYFFFERFGVEAGTIGVLFFLARVANALSHLGAAWLARRIGLLNTMVFTHIPSSLFLVLVAIAPNFPAAAVLFLLREMLVEMDVPTRQSYVMAVVRPEERVVASGITNLVRMAGWAVAPFLAGPLMEQLSLTTPLFLGAAVKITYDIMLYWSFIRLKPPEES